MLDVWETLSVVRLATVVGNFIEATMELDHRNVLAAGFAGDLDGGSVGAVVCVDIECAGDRGEGGYAGREVSIAGSELADEAAALRFARGINAVEIDT